MHDYYIIRIYLKKEGKHLNTEAHKVMTCK